MAMTMTQKILAAHAGLESVKAGQLIMAKLDLVLGNDITSPVAINEFHKNGFESVFDKTKITRKILNSNWLPIAPSKITIPKPITLKMQSKLSITV